MLTLFPLREGFTVHIYTQGVASPCRGLKAYQAVPLPFLCLTFALPLPYLSAGDLRFSRRPSIQHNPWTLVNHKMDVCWTWITSWLSYRKWEDWLLKISELAHFATMTLTAGGDIYTTSKMLGHTNIHTTEIIPTINFDFCIVLIDAIFWKKATELWNSLEKRHINI